MIAKKLLLASVISTILPIVAQADVITSIRPLAFIAAGIADGVTETQVLLPDGASPHDYALKPSDLRKIKQADLFVWVGPDMEMFLEKPLSQLDAKSNLALMSEPKIKALMTAGGDDHHHDDEPEHQDGADPHQHSKNDDGNFEVGHEHHSHGEYNTHIWLSPEIAKQAAQSIYDRLLVIYPDSKSKLDVNLRKFNEKMAQNDQEVANILRPAKNKGYFVFHDAYGYFEKHYQLTPLGHFTINPEIQPGAQKLHQIRTQLVEQKAECVFAEPQFRPAVIEAVAKGTAARMGTLDPLGSGIKIGPDSYMQFLTQLSEQYASCLN